MTGGIAGGQPTVEIEQILPRQSSAGSSSDGLSRASRGETAAGGNGIFGGSDTIFGFFGIFKSALLNLLKCTAGSSGDSIKTIKSLSKNSENTPSFSQYMSQIRTGIAKRFRAKREFQRFGFKHIETV